MADVFLCLRTGGRTDCETGQEAACNWGASTGRLVDPSVESGNNRAKKDGVS